MDLQLMYLQEKCDSYRKLANITNPFVFKQSNYDKYIFYKRKLTEYYLKLGYKVEAKMSKEKFLPMSDFTEKFEEYA